ncbi:hypothetical protein ALC56_08714 [Trachymyrmex septentrionalis]|uniref:Uncharacterized protein n=1 Tax=Trachymyrmex septentrionalis TaxID=34720 RepID=A0A195F904_9HYME|nr:PREDICTED: uncharacterized protein LOC108750618 [Trachymyrmex septentrionalis]KYN36923.1 hypothetical protein ALC56_08714 [Trachymyrmex septentrionalis]
MLALHGFLVIAACLVTVAIPPALAKAVYDQRQTGDVNVQIDLKDLQVIALVNSELLDDYTDYDYLYDYADFTIKPPGNRPIVSSTTEKNDVTQIFESLPSQNSTVSTSVNNTSPTTSDITLSEGAPNANPSNGTENDKTPSKDEEIPNADPLIGITSLTPNADNDDNKSQPGEKEAGTRTTPSTTVKSAHAVRSQKRCKFGYVPNGNGRCRSWLNRLLP